MVHAMCGVWCDLMWLQPPSRSNLVLHLGQGLSLNVSTPSSFSFSSFTMALYLRRRSEMTALEK